MPDVPQKIRARFKAVNPGSGMPPFIRVETENTSPEYRLEARRRSSDGTDDSLLGPTSFEVPPISRFEATQQDRRGPPPPQRRYSDGRGRGGRRGGGGGGGRFHDRSYRDAPRGPRPERYESRRTSSASYDAPRDEYPPARGAGDFVQIKTEPHENPTPDEIDQQAQEGPPTPGGTGQKRGYSDAFTPTSITSSRGYNLDDSAPVASRQRYD